MTDFIEFINKTKDIICVEALWRLARGELSNYGITSLLYLASASRIDASQEKCVTNLITKGDHPQEYFECFGEDMFLDNCASFEHCCYNNNKSPFIWHDVSEWEGASDAQFKQANIERDMGLYVGFSVSIGLFSPYNHGGFGVSMAELSEKEFSKIWNESQSDILSILGVLDMNMREKHLSKMIGLAPREKETLEWLCAGLRPDQISERMKISTKTVDKYICSSKFKLGARTRDHAVAKALTFNAIQP